MRSGIRRAPSNAATGDEGGVIGRGFPAGHLLELTRSIPIMLAVPLVLSAMHAHASPRRHIVVLDFEGGHIGPGDDTAASEAVCIPEPFRYPFFLGSGGVADEAVAEARRILAPYGVIVRASRPSAALPYTHVRLGGLPEQLGVDELVNGLSCRGIDCGDAAPSDTVFVFSDKYSESAAWSEPASERSRGITIGRIAVHEAAHAWGLEHSGAGDSIMAKFPSAAADQAFLVGCAPLDLVADSVCPDERERHCAPGEQDAHAELLARFGPGDADDVPPTIAIVSPTDGDAFASGTEITLEVELADDRGDVGWSFDVPELEYAFVAPPGERMRDLVLPAGVLTFRVQAIDSDGNVAEREVTIEVADPEDETTPPVSGCACGPPGPDGTMGAALLVMMVAPFGRRRRPRSPWTALR